MLLFIDTTQDTVYLALVSDNKTTNHFFKVNNNLSEKLTAEIKKFLAKQKINFSDLKKIGVVVGPGHFSKVRTAVAVANALAFGLQIPVIGLKAGKKIEWSRFLNQKGSDMVKPFYDKEPNITLSKKSI